MVKLTLVGRVNDGLPLAQGPRYVNDDNNESFSFYKQQAEFLLFELSRDALPPFSKITILVDHQYCFNLLMENGIAFITLSDYFYPRKLAFHYLQDLQNEFAKFDSNLISKIKRPYSFIKFDGIISNIRKQFIDTRTQANLSKLINANRQSDLDNILTANFTDILQSRRNSEIHESLYLKTDKPDVSSIWCSPSLEVIALRWMPITLIVSVAFVLLWASLILMDHFVISNHYYRTANNYI